MAKIGLNYGEKLQIVDKTYRVITDGLNVPEVLGKLSFRGIEGPDIIYEEDRTQRNPDGSFVQITLTAMIFTSSLLLKSRKRMEGHLLRKTNLWTTKRIIRR